MFENGFSCASSVPGLDGRDRLGEIHDARLGAEQLERSLLDLARQHADVHPLHVRRRVDRLQAIRDVAEAVLEVAEDPEVHPGFDAASSARDRARRPSRLAPVALSEKRNGRSATPSAGTRSVR